MTSTERKAVCIDSFVYIFLAFPFMFFGMRWMLQFAIYQHGLNKLNLWGATVFFYFFGVTAIGILVYSIANVGSENVLHVGSLLPAILSYSAVKTIEIAQRKNNLEKEQEVPLGGGSKKC